MQGSGISVTGTGSSGNPYVVATTGGTCPVDIDLAVLVDLQTAGTLDPCAVYRVTDWNTGPGSSLPGPNFVFARANSATELRSDVEIFVPSMESVGTGNIGPNRGSMLWEAGIMTEVWDSIGNHVLDIAVGTIGAFPWGNLSFINNNLANVTFTGGFAAINAVATKQMSSCVMSTSTIDPGGASSLTLVGVESIGSTFTAGAGSSLNLDHSVFKSSTWSVAASATLNADWVTSEFSTVSSGISLLVNSSTFRDVTFTANGTATTNTSVYASNFRGPGTLVFQGADVTYYVLASDISVPNSVTRTIDGAGGSVTIQWSRLVDPNFTRNAAATGDITIDSCDFIGGSFIFGAAATGATSLEGTRGASLNSSLFQINQQGAGLLRVINSILTAGQILTNNTVVRDITVISCTFSEQGGVNYFRTAPNTTSDIIQGCNISGGLLLINGATDPGLSQNFIGVNINSAAQVTVTNGATNIPLEFVTAECGSILNVTAGGKIIKSRVSGGGTLNTGAFTQTSVFHDSNATTTLTAANTNTMKNPLGSNVV